MTRPTTPNLLQFGVKKLNVEYVTMVDTVIGDGSYGMGGETVNLRQFTSEKPQATHLGKYPWPQEAPNVKLFFKDKLINSHQAANHHRTGQVYSIGGCLLYALIAEFMDTLKANARKMLRRRLSQSIVET